MNAPDESVLPVLATSGAALLVVAALMVAVRRRETRRTKLLLQADGEVAALERLLALMGFRFAGRRLRARWALAGFLDALNLPAEQRRLHERFGQTAAAVGAIGCRRVDFAEGRIVLDLHGPAEWLLHTVNCVLLAKHLVFLAFACVAGAEECVLQCWSEPTSEQGESRYLFSLRATRAKAQLIDPVRAHNAQVLKVLDARSAVETDEGIVAVQPHAELGN